MGMIALVYSVRRIAGPIVGGAISDSAAGWRWVSLLSKGGLFFSSSTTNQTVRLLPFVFCYIGSIMICSLQIPKSRYFMLWYLARGVCLGIGGVCWYSVNQETLFALTNGYSVALGIGMTGAQAAYTITPKLASPDMIPNTIQFFSSAQGQGYLAGLTIASSIFQHRAFQGLQDVLGGPCYSDAEIHGAVSGARSHILREISDEMRKRCISVIVGSMSNVWIMVVAGGAVVVLWCCILICTFRDHRLRDVLS